MRMQALQHALANPTVVQTVFDSYVPPFSNIDIESVFIHTPPDLLHNPRTGNLWFCEACMMTQLSEPFADPTCLMRVQVWRANVRVAGCMLSCRADR